jgi:hypothetical protein
VCVWQGRSWAGHYVSLYDPSSGFSLQLRPPFFCFAPWQESKSYTAQEYVPDEQTAVQPMRLIRPTSTVRDIGSNIGNRSIRPNDAIFTIRA